MNSQVMTNGLDKSYAELHPIALTTSGLGRETSIALRQAFEVRSTGAREKVSVLRTFKTDLRSFTYRRFAAKAAGRISLLNCSAALLSP